MAKLRGIGLLTLLLPLGCSGEEPVSREESCAVPAPTECPDPAPTYADVTPIIEEKCNNCHDGVDPLGPWPFESYDHIASWYDLVRDELLACNMPPEDGVPLTPAERLTLMEWTLCGMPE